MTTDPWEAPYPREALVAADRAVGASFGRGDSSLAIACRALEAATESIRVAERDRLLSELGKSRTLVYPPSLTDPFDGVAWEDVEKALKGGP